VFKQNITCKFLGLHGVVDVGLRSSCMWDASVDDWCPTFEDNVVVSFSRSEMSKKIFLDISTTPKHYLQQVI